MSRQERLQGKKSGRSAPGTAGSVRKGSQTKAAPLSRAPDAAKPATAKSASRGRPPRNAAQLNARREAILKAALKVFAEQGFEAARLDEVARQAGVAKGTLYLYFPDKQAMFEAIVQTAAGPVVAEIVRFGTIKELTFSAALEKLYSLFASEILGTERKLVLRLILAEGPRFPEIAAYYHREILSHIQGVLRTIARRAIRRGELPDDSLVRFPQLIAAPLVLSLIWDGLFQRIEPLDVEAMLGAYRKLLAAGGNAQ